MEIRFDRVTEYVLVIDDDDTDALAMVDAILTRNQLQGETMADRVFEVYVTDNVDVLAALAEVPDVEESDTWTCQMAEGPDDDEPEPEEDDQEDSTAGGGYVDALNLPAWR